MQRSTQLSEHKADEDQSVDMDDADFEEEEEDAEDIPPDVGLLPLLTRESFQLALDSVRFRQTVSTFYTTAPEFFSVWSQNKTQVSFLPNAQ
jgi:hypothetical protein